MWQGNISFQNVELGSDSESFICQELDNIMAAADSSGMVSALKPIYIYYGPNDFFGR